MKKLLEEQTIQILNMDGTRISPDFFPFALSCNMALAFINIFFISMKLPKFRAQDKCLTSPWS